MEGFLVAAMGEYLLVLGMRVLQRGLYVTPGYTLELVSMVLKVIAMATHLAAGAAALLAIPVAEALGDQGIALPASRLRLIAGARGAVRGIITFVAPLAAVAVAA
jgi:hypothetical protein